MPKISVIVPIYNVDKYLDRCIKSLVEQTLEDIELIFINDASTDNSMKILEKYNHYNNIKIINLLTNKGVSFARNEGLKIASGEFIGFVDGDDYLEKDFYEKLYSHANSHNCDIVRGNVLIHDKITEIQKNKTYKLEVQDCKMSFASNFWSAIYKREIIYDNNLKFNENYINGEDLLFLYQCLIYAKKVEFVYSAFYNYIRHSGSLDSDYLDIHAINSALNARKDIMKLINNAFENNRITKKEYIKAYSSIYSGISYSLFKNNSYEVKYICAKSYIDNYDLCKFKEILDDTFQYKYLIDFIKSKQIDKLTKEFAVVKKEEDFDKRRILYQLRNKHLSRQYEETNGNN